MSECGNVSAAEALARLEAGNRRFALGTTGDGSLTTRPSEAAGEQRPFAIILGCSDSRVPAEIVFDQGLGDLFVIRVAGNVVAASQIGSVEFAATKFGTRLVVVLGHTQCGAVLAAVEQLQVPDESRSRNLRSIVDFVRPSVEECVRTGAGDDQATLVGRAVRANIDASVLALQHGSEILEELIEEEGLVIVGAEYCLQSGRVEFLAGLEAMDRA